MGIDIGFAKQGARIIAARLGSVATSTALKALTDSSVRAEGDTHTLESNGSVWRYSASSTAADTTENLVLTPSDSTGRWIRQGSGIFLRLAVAYATADAAVLFTVPTGFELTLRSLWWEITTGFTGGTSSAIGISSSNAAYNTAGDLLGGAAGALTASIGSASKAVGGTIGTKFGSNGRVTLVAGNTIIFNRIASVYTAGAGFACVDVLARNV